jgi:hypothetical protein
VDPTPSPSSTCAPATGAPGTCIASTPATSATSTSATSTAPAKWTSAHACWFTGDTQFLPYALWQLDVARNRIVTDGDPALIGAVDWTFEHASECTLANQLPAVAALLDALEPAALPRAVGPNALGNGPIYLHQTEDRELTVTVQVAHYPVMPGSGATPFLNARRWTERLDADDRPALVMTAPDGAQLARFDLLGDPQQPFATATASTDGPSLVRFTLPADGRIGTYALEPTGAAPLQVTLTESNADGIALGASDPWISAILTHFLFPAGTGAFALEVKALALRTSVGVTVADARGRTLAREQWSVGSECRHDWVRFEMDAGRPARDEVWSISLLSPTPMHLRFEGVPGHVAVDPDTLFRPQRTLGPSRPTVPEGDAPGRIASPLPAGGAGVGTAPAGGARHRVPGRNAAAQRARRNRGAVAVRRATARRPGQPPHRG